MAHHVAIAPILTGLSGAALASIAFSSYGAVFPRRSNSSVPGDRFAHTVGEGRPLNNDEMFKTVEHFLRIGPSVVSSAVNSNTAIIVPSGGQCHRLWTQEGVENRYRDQRKVIDDFNQKQPGAEIPVEKLVGARAVMSGFLFPTGVYQHVASRLTKRQFGEKLAKLSEVEQEIVDAIVKHAEKSAKQ
jgi:hypothetical protein